MSEYAAMGQVGGDMVARREKHWDELDDAGKMERMRQEVKRLMRTVANQAETISALRNHSHGMNGDLLVPMNGRNNISETGYRQRDDYF